MACGLTVSRRCPPRGLGVGGGAFFADVRGPSGHPVPANGAG